MNLVILKGRLGKDPELRKTRSDLSVTSFSIAVNRGYGEKKTTDWFNLVAWRNTAEFICKYFKKGDEILIEGSLQTGSYEDKSGSKINTVEALVSQVHFVGGKNNDNDYVQNHDDFDVIGKDEDLPF